MGRATRTSGKTMAKIWNSSIKLEHNGKKYSRGDKVPKAVADLYPKMVTDGKDQNSGTPAASGEATGETAQG